MGKIVESKDLGRLLVEEGLIAETQLEAARAAQAAQEKSIGRILVDMGLISEEAKIAFLHKRMGFEIVDIGDMVVPQDILRKISRSYVEKYRCVPILTEDNHLVLAMEDPTNIVVLDEIQHQVGMDVVPVLATLKDIERIIEQYPQVSQDQADRIRSTARAGRLWRTLHPIVFFALLFLPVAAVMIMAKFAADTLSRLALKLGSPFDITLYGILVFALWAMAVWEIDALLLRPDKKP